MIAILFVAIVLGVAQCEPVPSPSVSARCDLKHPDSRLSNRYWETVAHAIHSIDVQALQKFNDKIDRDNEIPTVNMNLHSDEKVLDNAPDNPLPQEFSTPEMNMIDRILTRVGVSDDGLGTNWTPLERIVHNFHMKDLWSKIKPVHDKIEVDPGACICLLNMKENGIRAGVEWVAHHYETGTPITLLGRPIPALNDAADWKIWKDRLLHYYSEEAIYDAAFFLKCATN